MAYMLQALGYLNQNENEEAAKAASRAYSLRSRVSERESTVIDAAYQQCVTQNLDASRKAYEVWEELYREDSTPPNQLGAIYIATGEYDKALAEYKKSVAFDPQSVMDNLNVANAYLFLNRPKDAEAVVQESQARHIDSVGDHSIMYVIAFLRHDPAGMAREKQHLIGVPGIEDQLWEFDSDSAASAGKYSTARALAKQAADSAQRAKETEVAASYIAESGLRDALVGNIVPAKQQAEAAISASGGAEVEAIAAITLALVGDTSEAERLSKDLNHRFPDATIVQFNYLPTIRTALALQAKNGKALEMIAPAERYELGYVGNGATFNGYPVYFRGEAYLANGQGALAVAEFQKIIDHPGIILNEPIGALAHLEIGRAYALAADQQKSEAEYQQFLTLWKDADPDIPIYKQAKSEYAVLHKN
jgi:tetratricopeptide (TPR) repeat protein